MTIHMLFPSAVLYEMSTLLNTGLDRESLALCVSLCESGVNPEALAAVIKELKRESAAFKVIECGSCGSLVILLTEATNGASGATNRRA
ncbi:mitotic-spindle organizing gamma-tubulin ring associated-domain-containing protein [Endogone sp. FLAS-F59071]|nr:mitotic-spindle organizing gamma-tubulin ring associated-domain-containing protein [Endogone sp. FLAS-F59071]|eukprot:RUS21002.1 mitotic-spindle organizing gamma-tubulin ring associated-domain-containing protein [Endogone sp. FLAS-F59071]